MAESYPIEWVELGGLEPGAQAFVTTDVLQVPGGVLVRCVAHVTSVNEEEGRRIDNTSMTVTFVPKVELDMTDRSRPALRYSARHNYV